MRTHSIAAGRAVLSPAARPQSAQFSPRGPLLLPTAVVHHHKQHSHHQHHHRMAPRQRALRIAAPTAPPVPARQPSSSGKPGGATPSARPLPDGTAPLDSHQLLLAKAWNFLAGASGVALFPYINVYLAQRGLSPGEIGLLAALRTWAAAPAGFAGTAAADRGRLHTQLLLGSCLLACGLRSSLPLLASPGLLFAALLAADLLGAPTGVLADATVLSHCDEARGATYGKQRLWGSLGFGLASLPASWLIGHSGLGLDSCFVAYAALSLPLLAVTAGMRYNYSSSSSSSSGALAPAAQQQRGELLQLLLQPAWLVFLFRCVLLGFGMGLMGNFTIMWVQSLGAPPALLGVAIAVSVTTEVPAFMLQGALLRRADPEQLLNLGLAALTLRLALYGLLPLAHTPWAVLPIELLHGLTFGVSWGAATACSTRLAPPRLAATAQGAWQAACAIGAGMGGLVGGVLMEHSGGQGMWFTTAAMVAGGTLLAAAASRWAVSSSSTGSVMMAAAAARAVKDS